MKTKARRKKTKLSHISRHVSRTMVQTTVCIPLALRAFVLRESKKPFPGSLVPMGVSRWIQKLIIEENARIEAAKR